MESMWIVAAMVAFLAVLVGLGRFLWAMRPNLDAGDLPATPLERLGWIGLGVTGCLAVGLIALVAVGGVSGFTGEGSMSTLFNLMLLVGIVVWVFAWRRLRGPSGSTVVDERDRAIQARSFAVESVLVILSLVTWTVVLTEIFRDEGALPLGYLQLIFWSTFILGAMGRTIGIVLGYRREPSPHA